MDNESIDPQEEELSLFQRWRKGIFPIRPDDTASVKMIKHSSFYLLTVMVIVITVTIVIAIMFVL